MLAERLAQVSDAGATRVDRKLNEILRRIEQRREEFLDDFQRRFSDVENELRSQIRTLGADAEARVLEPSRPARQSRFALGVTSSAEPPALR